MAANWDREREREKEEKIVVFCSLLFFVCWQRRNSICLEIFRICRSSSCFYTHSELGARCLIWLASGKLLYQLSFTLPCGKVCRVTWRRHSWIEEQEQEQHPSWDSVLVWATGWQQTTLVLVFSLSLSVSLNEIELKFTFLIICVAALICRSLSRSHIALSLSRSVSDSFAHSHLISVKSANYSPLLYGGASTCRPNWLKINNNYYAIYIYMVCVCRLEILIIYDTFYSCLPPHDEIVKRFALFPT